MLKMCELCNKVEVVGWGFFHCQGCSDAATIFITNVLNRVRAQYNDGAITSVEFLTATLARTNEFLAGRGLR